MDTIDTFLEAMFAPYPATPRLLEAKRELHAMMEDAYADAIAAGKSHNEAVGSVITDFGNLEELAPVLGILPDIRGTNAEGGEAPTGEREAADGAYADAPTAPGATPPDCPVITLPQAQALAEARRTTATLLGNGVALCVLAAAPLFLALSLSQSDDGFGVIPLNEDQATAVGLPLTLVVVALAVTLLIRRHRAFVGLTQLTDGKFTRNPVVSAWAARLRLEHEPARSRALAIAVALWIMAPIPVVGAGILFQDHNGGEQTLGLSIALLIVALGLRIFLPTTWASMTHATVTEEGRPADAAPTWRHSGSYPFTDAIAGPYWIGCLAIYLAWSFIRSDWEVSWMVWPIAGVLFGAIAAGEAGLRSWRSRRSVQTHP
ncbi:permease prefix domain 1-containing protein [Actinomyces ruminicola]|uniref:permease prefix domain 1-containing protein n=1 Tax=Actinomyces ruminicola TaxID=332524 RepID=UPI00164F9781|nr:permease prefix domain 1-containing protein [Actinomyces ruminicola]